MKKLLLISISLIALYAFGQKNITLTVTHKLGNQAFALQQAASNNLGNTFSTSRLEYYISNIILVHDGGTTTPVTGQYILANASDSVTIQALGSFNITNLEAIRFAIGVDQASNHLDPSSYPASHPLAPKSPSMHWGWAAGYRFIAMEGKGGTSLTFTYELHTVDDENYFAQTIATAGISAGSNLTITLNADYEQALRNIDVNSGVVVHGSSGAAKTLAQNFAWHVFTSSEGNAAMAIAENVEAETFQVSPNPTNGQTFVRLQNIAEDATVVVTDITGRRLNLKVENGVLNVQHLPKGVYIISATQQNRTTLTNRLVITE